MNDPLGGNTEDLITQRRPHPTEHSPDKGMAGTEASNRHYGHILGAIGAALAVIPFVISIVIAALNPQAIDDEGRSGRILSIVLFTAITIGIVMMGVACLERLTRYNRTLMREVLDNQDTLRQELANAQEERQYLIGVVAPIAGRLAAIEQKVEGVRGFSEGVEVGTKLLGDLMDPRSR